jgi:hypothetical protein
MVYRRDAGVSLMAQHVLRVSADCSQKWRPAPLRRAGTTLSCTHFALWLRHLVAGDRLWACAACFANLLHELRLPASS